MIGNGSAGHPSYQTPRIVLSIPLLDMYRTLQPSRRVDPCSPYSLLLPTGRLGDPFFKFETELFPCARHLSCQFFHSVGPSPRTLGPRDHAGQAWFVFRPITCISFRQGRSLGLFPHMAARARTSTST